MNKHIRTSLRYMTAATKLWAALVLGFSVMFPVWAANAGSGIALKQTAVIEGNTIRLGDVFEGLTTNHDKVLGAAPLPGNDMVLNARTLLRIALATDLPWRPGTSQDHVVIRRAATIVSTDSMKESLQHRLHQDGVDGEYDVIFTNGNNAIILPPDSSESVEVQSLDLDRENGRFKATFAAPSVSNPVRTHYATGMIERLVEVPVLKNTARKGEVIGANDIDIISIKESDLAGNVALDIEQLIGMTPRRIVSAGRTVNMNDLEAPQVIERGGLVTMTYENGPLKLTAQGKALENGAKGDIIRVSNIASGKTLEAHVTGEGAVKVISF